MEKTVKGDRKVGQRREGTTLKTWWYCLHRWVDYSDYGFYGGLTFHLFQSLVIDTANMYCWSEKIYIFGKISVFHANAAGFMFL